MTETTDTTLAIWPAERAGDQRYTAERIAGYSRDELQAHLDERLAQRDRAKRDMQNAHRRLELAEDPDSSYYRDALHGLSSATAEHATQRGIIRRLERAIAERDVAERRGRTAQHGHADIPVIDDAIARLGMPCGVEESQDDDLARQLWDRALIGLENELEADPTAGAVADRVADAYGLTYGYVSPDRTHADQAAREGAAADAARYNHLRQTRFAGGTPIDAAITNALLAIILDPWLRGRLDVQILEQARRALGIAD